MHLYTFVCINAANNWGICVSWRVSVRSLGAELENVHFLEFKFVLDIHIANNWGKCVSWRVSVRHSSSGMYIF